MHSSRMRTARSSSRPRGIGGGVEGLHQAPSWDQAPPQTRHPPWDQARPPVSGTPPWTETLTHATQNITLPQTSFAGGNNE